MSEFETSKFKKRIWGCSESVKALSSKDSVSQEVVANDSDIQCFTHSDAMRQHDLSSSTNLCSANVSSGCSNVVGHKNEVTHSGSCNSINTCYFYSTAVDKKCVQGHLARGKKATVVAKQFAKPMKVNTRIFVPRFEPKSCNTRQEPNAKPPNVHCDQYCGSGKGVTHGVTFHSNVKPPSFVVGQDNENPVPIVDAGVKSRTSCLDNGGLINQPGVNNANNGHLSDAHHALHNDLVVSLGDKSSLEKVSSVDRNDPEDNRELGVCIQVNNGTECQQSSLQTNVFNARQGIDTSGNVLLYDVNIDSCDDNFELSNAMLLKDG